MTTELRIEESAPTLTGCCADDGCRRVEVAIGPSLQGPPRSESQKHEHTQQLFVVVVEVIVIVVAVVVVAVAV